MIPHSLFWLNNGKFSIVAYNSQKKLNLHLLEITPLKKLKYFNPTTKTSAAIGGIALMKNGKTTIVSDKEGIIYFVEFNID